MLVPVSVIILASQLVIAIADDVPKYDIARGCKIDSAAAFDPNAGMSGTIKRCVDDEQRALFESYRRINWPEKMFSSVGSKVPSPARGL
jgi:hypothetical protein